MSTCIMLSPGRQRRRRRKRHGDRCKSRDFPAGMPAHPVPPPAGAGRDIAPSAHHKRFRKAGGMATMGGRLRLGMIGGGRGSQIGDSHRLAARLDYRYTLAAGALDIDPARGRDFALELGIAPERAYADWRAMVEGERARPDPVELVTIATPNASHHPIAKACL